ncbi:TPA: cell division protein FtsZ [Candidatus Dojkabacteria bacterium]|jgi:cell division protein FtsZ|uniref:Cell division protein FtsZ n=1 Tax=Candidatus Dojkabacteria bacterium TaxID=2099670 RepID=A0A832QH97_9BACT|nr:cell division protein FtsZ [Candidatus Dojkabacteria bacterium]
MPLVTTNVDPVAKIKVIGVGGGGCNAINTMITDYDIAGVEFMAFNTDAQALKMSQAPITLQLGEELTKGLGVGGNAELGAQAAEESLDQIQEYLEGANMVFITAGMGGGTGTGAAPVIAGVAKNMGALTVAVVTKPFDFEGSKRMEIAEEGIAKLRDKVDTLIIVPNQRLLEVVNESEKLSFIDAMKKVDSVLAEGVNSISNLISETGYINADFNDAKSVMENAGTALMGIGRASGENRAEDAARLATTSPLLDMSIEGATGVLYNIVGGTDLSLAEISEVSELIKEAVDPSANIKFGAQINPDAGDELTITIVATGFDESKQIYRNRTSEDTHSVPPVRTFGFDSNTKETETLEQEKDTETLDSFDSDEDDMEEDTVDIESTADAINNMQVEDPLDVPAFMRGKK